MTKKSLLEKWAVRVGLSIWYGSVLLVTINKQFLTPKEAPIDFSLAEITIMGIGMLGAAVAGGIFLARAWTKNADEYDKWLKSQRFLEPYSPETERGPFLKKFNLWQTRLGTIVYLAITVLVVIILTGHYID